MTSRGLPSVSVPVLSTTSVSTLLQGFEGLGVLDQHAGCRAPARADHDRHRRGQAQRAGAGDDQHRHGVDQGVRQRGSGPTRRPRPRTSAPRPPAPRARSSRRPRSASRWIGARLRCASLTMRTICASSVSPPTRSARIDQAAGAVDRAADRPRRPVSFSTGIGSPVIIDSSTVLRPSSTTPSTGTFSPGPDAQPIAGLHLLERHVLFAAVVATDRRASWAPGPAARGSRRRSGCAPAAPAPGRAGPATVITAAASK